MLALDNVPIDLHAEYMMAYEARAIHDVATLRHSDYLAGGAADWVVAVVKPVPGSGSASTPGAYLDATTGQLMNPGQAKLVLTLQGSWQRLAAADPTAPTNGNYHWAAPMPVRPRTRQAEDVYSPFAHGGVIVFAPRQPATGAEGFAACKLLFADWGPAAGEALRAAHKAEQIVRRTAASDNQNDDLMALLTAPNPLLATLSLSLAFEAQAALATRASDLLKGADPRRLSAWVYLALSAPTRDRAQWLHHIAAMVSQSATTERLLAIAYAAYAVGLFGGSASGAQDDARTLLAKVKERNGALGLTPDADAQFKLLFQKSNLP